MSEALPAATADPVRDIPTPDAIRGRLYEVRAHARLLSRLLRLAESKQALSAYLPRELAAGGQR